MKYLILLPITLLLTSCGTPGPASNSLSPAPIYSSGRMQEIINVSSYDPKERQRNGRSYSASDVSALRANGAVGLIARAGKGGRLDGKCSTFLASADRNRMLPGVYYRLQTHIDAVRQADQFVNRAQALARSRNWNASHLLLCGDYDAKSRLSDITRFMDRVEKRTGVVPICYLENSPHLKTILSRANRQTKAKLRRAPYWLALYSHTSGDGPLYPAPGNPRNLVRQYNVWGDWTLWQYGGVNWEGGRSRPKVYNHRGYRFRPYFGNLDRPIERNVFRGSRESLDAFWQRHGIALR